MQIVIDINDKLYDRIKYLEPTADTMLDKLMKSVQNGTPLQKGHGRLIDAGYKVSSDGRTIDNVCGYMAPTIIEADSTESEDKE